MGFLSGARKGGSTKNSKGREVNTNPIKLVRSEKFICNRKGKIGPRARAQTVGDSGEKRSSSGVAKVGILRLRFLWMLNAHGCQLLLRRGVVPWWRRGSYATKVISPYFIHRPPSEYFHYFKFLTPPSWNKWCPMKILLALKECYLWDHTRLIKT